MITPNQLAAELAGDDNAERIGKSFVRPFLRRHFTRDPALKGSGWILDDATADIVRDAYAAKVAGQPYVLPTE